MKILCAIIFLSQSSKFLLASDLPTLYPNWSIVKNERLVEDGIEIDTVENIVKEMDDKNAIAIYRKAVINRSYKYMFLLAFYGHSILFTTSDETKRKSVFNTVYKAIKNINIFMDHYRIPMKNLNEIIEVVHEAVMCPEDAIGTLDTMGDYIKTQFPNPKEGELQQNIFILNTKAHNYNWDIYRSVITDFMKNENIYPPNDSDEVKRQKHEIYFEVINALENEVLKEYAIDKELEVTNNFTTFYALNAEIDEEEAEENKNRLIEKLRQIKI